MIDGVRHIELLSLGRLHSPDLELEEELRSLQFCEESGGVWLRTRAGFECEVVVQLVLEGREVSVRGVGRCREGLPGNEYV
jgi:hypothetical protein